MKLNPDCIRDILLLIGDIQEMETKSSSLFPTNSSDNETKYFIGSVNKIRSGCIVESERLENYSEQDIWYSIKQLRDAYLIDALAPTSLGGTSYIINDITPSGHEFLNNVRENKIWNKVKNTSKDIGIKSLGGMLKIASAVISEIIKSYINTNLQS